MPLTSDTGDTELLPVAEHLFLWAQESHGATGLQIWIADDTGFHPHAILGNASADFDRRSARQSCLQQQAVAGPQSATLPLTLGDRHSGACVIRLPNAPSPLQLLTLQAHVTDYSDAVEGAFQRNRLGRLSGLARQSNVLRQVLQMAHSLEHSEDLQSSIGQIRSGLAGLMYAENFFVAVLDDARTHLHFVYFRDSFESSTEPIPFREGHLDGSLSAFVVAAGRVLRGSSEELLQVAGHGDTLDNDSYGPPAADWLGVPMVVAGECMGAVVVQSYEPAVRFADADPSTLQMVADTMASALHRRRVRELLERQVIDRTRAYEEANHTLQQTVETLERAMDQLVQAEKLASLGSMVAGISHELNTPIGTALTASTTLEVHFADFARSAAHGQMTRSGLAQFIAQGVEMNRLVVRSIQRADGLIASFKQVAIDQTSEQRRVFDVAQVVESIVAANRATPHRPGVRLTTSVVPGLQSDSYPGPLGQVLSNLIRNALIHAYRAEDAGTIEITVQGMDNSLQVCVADDGAGMSAYVMARAFDPFFTTQLGKGGSGLGLTVCHRLVTSVLGGTLTVMSALQTGTRFTLRMPFQAPYKL